MINFLPLGFEQSYVDHQDPFTHEISDYWEGSGMICVISQKLDVLFFANRNFHLRRADPWHRDIESGFYGCSSFKVGYSFCRVSVC